MDNNGGASAVSGENGPILTPPESMPNGEIENFDEFLQNDEALGSNFEQSDDMNAEAEAAAPEMAAEQASSAMPAMPAPIESEGEAVSKELQTAQGIEIARDAESLPKEYVNAVANVIRSDKDDPAQLSADCDVLRWDLMKKAFGRNLGDGLNGTGAA